MRAPLHKLLLIAAAWALMPVPAYAESVIFSDDFNRSSSYDVGNNWIEYETFQSEVYIATIDRPPDDHVLVLDDNGSLPSGDAGVAQLGLSTVGDVGVTLSFEYRGVNTDQTSNPFGCSPFATCGPDFLTVEWKPHTATDWIALATFILVVDDWETSGALVLGSQASNTLIDIRIWARILDPPPNDDELALIDNVVLSGTPTAVPLPAALPLFAGGLGLMGWIARRKRRQAAHA